MKTISQVPGAGLACLCVLGLATLSGCAEPPYRTTVYMETSIPEDYVYYPGYEVYYSYSHHDYICRDGDRWVRSPFPRGVSAQQLRAAASVRMEFHDSPARHHNGVVRAYPRNWHPEQRSASHEENRHDGR